MRGTVVAAFGRSYLVEADGGPVITCFPRGKRSEIACGDRVRLSSTSPDQGVIDAIEPRTSLFYRSDAFRQKLIAANVSQIVLVLATSPTWYEELLNRCLVAAECAGARAIIVLNKADLPATVAALAELEPYARLGYALVPLCARDSVAPLQPWLQGQTSVLVGQSGMGKSTIINGLFPDARAATSSISAALDSGRHTTTHARLYRGGPETSVIDSPGLQEFGLHHLVITDLDAGFPEFRPLLGTCRFANCRHLQEPGCALDAAADAGKVARRRLHAYRAIALQLLEASAR